MIDLGAAREEITRSQYIENLGEAAAREARDCAIAPFGKQNVTTVIVAQELTKVARSEIDPGGHCSAAGHSPHPDVRAIPGAPEIANPIPVQWQLVLFIGPATEG